MPYVVSMVCALGHVHTERVMVMDFNSVNVPCVVRIVCDLGQILVSMCPM